jgi:hypothetical protein
MNKIQSTLVIFLLPTYALALSAKDIMDKNEEVRRLRDIKAKATLVTGGADKKEKRKKFTWWRKLTSDKVHFNTLTRFHEPSEIKNEGILFLEHEQDNSDVLLYLPTYKKIRRVERNNQSGSFMGSELSYADIATPHSEDYDFKELKKEKCPSKESDCTIIEAIPKRSRRKSRTSIKTYLKEKGSRR